MRTAEGVAEGLLRAEAFTGGGPKNTAVDVVQEVVVLERRGHVAHRRVEGATSVIVVGPGDGAMRDTLLALLGTPVGQGVEGVDVELQQVFQFIGPGGIELIPFVGENEALGEAIHAREIGVRHFEGGGLHRGVNVEHVADHFGIPIPFVFGIGRAVDADKPLARLDEAFEGALLFLVEDVTGGQEEDDDIVVGQKLVVHDPIHVVAPKNIEIVQLGQLLQGDHPRGAGIVMPAIGFADQERLELGGVGDKTAEKTEAEKSRAEKAIHDRKDTVGGSAWTRQSTRYTLDKISLRVVVWRRKPDFSTPVQKPLCIFLWALAGALSAESTSVIRWNQQGYAADQPKVLVVMSQRDLAGAEWSVSGPGGGCRDTLAESEVGRGPNTPWPFNHFIDLGLELQKPGDYTLRVGELDPVVVKVREQPYVALANLPLVHLRMQRSGTETVKWREASHFGDAAAWLKVPDGDPADGQWKAAPNDRRVDVQGGWYDAGDHLKFTLTTAYTIYHLLLAYEVAPEIFDKRHSTSDLPDILDEIRHGLTYLLKLWPDRDTFIVQVGDSTDHGVGWRLPADDQFDGQRPAKAALARTQMAATVAALARGARVMADFDPALAARCAEMARGLMDRIQEPDTVPVAFERAPTNDFYLDRSEDDQMSLAALEMAVLDQDRNWLRKARASAPGKGREVSWSYWHWLPNSGLAAARKPVGRRSMRQEVGTYLAKAAGPGQPWGLPGRYVWGSVARWIGAANASRVAAAQQLVGPEGDYLFFGVLDYVLGRNNWGVSFLFDERLPNHLEQLYSPTAHLMDRFPTGALSAGPTTRQMHAPLEPFFNEPDGGRLAAFDTEVAVFHDNRWDFVCHESTIGAQADIILMLALASSRGDADPLGWNDLP